MFAHFGTIRKVSVTSCVLLAGLAVACMTVPANAGPGNGAKREPQAVSNAQLREGLHVLQTTKKMLEGADHDYGGHRVAAIRAIGVAERQLTRALHWQHKGAAPGGKVGPGVGGSGAGRGKQPEPQGISNLQLADAIVILERTRGVLEMADHDYGGHRAAAVRDIGGAIRQLKVALKYEKKVK
jgi:hypothetical protein